MITHIHSFKNLLLASNYGTTTKIAYENSVSNFLSEISPPNIESITENVLRSYLMNKINDGRHSESYISNIFRALKLFYKWILDKEVESNLLKELLDSPKAPIYLCKEDVQKLFDNTKNTKHKCILSLIYATEISLGELTRLKVQDIDLKQNILNISDKNEPKHINFPEKIKPLLLKYLNTYIPSIWLFESPQKIPYSPKSIQLIFKKSIFNSQISKSASLFSLRNGYNKHIQDPDSEIQFIKDHSRNPQNDINLKYRSRHQIGVSIFTNSVDSI